MFLASPKSSLIPIALPPSSKGDVEKQDLKLDDDKDPFDNALEKIFTKTKKEDEPSVLPKLFVSKKEDETKNEETNFLLNPIFSSSYLFQPQWQNQNPTKEALLLEPQIELNPLEPKSLLSILDASEKNLKLDGYQFFEFAKPINIDKNLIGNINLDENQKITTTPFAKENNSLKDNSKYELVDVNLVKNEDNLIKAFNINDSSINENIQKGDLVFINKNPINSGNKNIPVDMNIFNPNINIEVSDINFDMDKIQNNNGKNVIDQLNKGFLNQKGIQLNENLVAYPVAKIVNDSDIKTDYYLFKKEFSPSGEKQQFIGVISKDNDHQKDIMNNKNSFDPKDFLFIDNKNNFSEINKSIKYDLNKNNSFYMNDVFNNKNNLNEIDIENPNFELKDLKIKTIDSFVRTNKMGDNFKTIKISGNEDELRKIDMIDPKNQLQVSKLNESNQKEKTDIKLPVFSIENIVKDKKEINLSKNNFNIFTNEKSKLDGLKFKDLNEDSFFSFMSSDSDNQTKENKKELNEKSTSENKGLVFEKTISSQANTPIILSDKSNADFSNPMVSAATRRAVDLSSQLQARGGGNAKIQIQDEKFGSIELNIHMKKDNTVSMEIKATDKDLKNILEQNSDTLKKTLDSQNISLTDFKVSTVESKSIQAGLGGTTSQGFSQQQFNQNSNNGNNQDFYQQNLAQGFMSNSFSNGNNSFFNRSDDDYSFSKSSNQSYINSRNNFSKNMEKNSITNIQRGANGSIKVNV
ncbi:hypothetical protein GCL60_12800 [Silvanigrella paludirubra]|uniref:Flagellar hook-length control protein-like C-terminal domain-containing protein n=1 Tax=Silvanigrella paludirubra TaxID=2499159 RepID=A0A6N6VVY4_9BACT|nr:flagellar hook-length control protein FliK [Silvanigrella paludirubra]KAB8038045.1 hypothetical protein GCL60_12800 [Silvanigrella paludirubra]